MPAVRPVGQQHDDREDHRRGADHRGADQHRLGRRLEGVAGAVVLLEEVLGLLEVGVEAEVLLDLLLDARDASRSATARRPTGRCRSPGRRSRRRWSPGPCRGSRRPPGRRRRPPGRAIRSARPWVANAVGDRPSGATIAQAHPVGAEVAGDQAGQDVERGAALARGGDDLPDVAGLGRGEDLDQLGDDRAGQRAAGDDGRELPPQRAVAERRRSISVRDARRSRAIETSEVSQTSEVSGASKFISSASLVLGSWRWPR